MTDELLHLIAKFKSSADSEMQDLASTMILEHRLTDEDISRLNHFMGYPPMTYMLNDIQVKHMLDVIRINDFECNIF